MDPFQALKYGNVIEVQGKKLMVLHTVKNAAGATQFIGVVEALSADDLAMSGSPGFTVISALSSETVLTGRTIPGGV